MTILSQSARCVVYALLCTFAMGLTPIQAEYDPPTYEPHRPCLKSLSVSCPRDVAAGESFSIIYDVNFARYPEGAYRLFAHFVQDGKVFHVADFDVPDDGKKGRSSTRLGPFEVTLPDEAPRGQYKLIAGMHGETRTAEHRLVVANAQWPAQPLIISTGTYVDKHGQHHRWHVNRAHTLFWDGRPWLPVGGMMIPDRDLDTFKAQIDLLVRFNVRDIYFNVGSSVHMPHTWETKSDEDLRVFQACVDYMDQRGIRYGLELSGLQAHGNAYDLTGGVDVRIRVDGEGKASVVESSADRVVRDGRLRVFVPKISGACYLVRDEDTHRIVAHGVAQRDREKHPDRENEERQVVCVNVAGLKAGDYVVQLCTSLSRDSWNDNMLFWGDQTTDYYRAIRDLYGKMRLGPGFRFFVDAFWNENNMNHGYVPDHPEFRSRLARWLKAKYGDLAHLRAAWAFDEPKRVESFDFVSMLVPVRFMKDPETDRDWVYFVHRESGELLRCRHDISQYRYDLLESTGKQVRDYHIEVANVLKSLFDVPVIFKNFSGTDFWHINDAGIPDGFDGLGMETYGLGEPTLTFMAINAFGECEQYTKTSWLIATEIGEGNHQDQALSQNKLFGCTSRLGTMYPTYSALLGAGAKGLFHYYMLPSPGVDRFWDDTIVRDPRQLEWLGTYADIVEHAPQLVDYKPRAAYRFPALFHANSGLLFSDPYRDYTNTDTLWWVDPAGKLANGTWLLPTFRLDVPAEMLLIHLEQPPATLRFGDDVSEVLKSGRRITWLGFRRDRGVLPEIDQYYTDQWSEDADGVTFQVLKPTPSSRVLGRGPNGEVWNLVDGSLQIISKDASNCPGWRPQGLLLDEQDIHFDYDTFLSDVLGVRLLSVGGPFEGFTYQTGEHTRTVVSLAPPHDAVVCLAEDLPRYSLDSTGNVTAPATTAPSRITLPQRLDKAYEVHYASGEPITSPSLEAVELVPDELKLIRSERRFRWAPEGLLFDTEKTKATAIIQGPRNAKPLWPVQHTDAPRPGSAGHGMIVMEAENPTTSNFNLDVFSALAQLSGDAMLGLASACPPPAPDGFVAEYDFNVARSGPYQLWIRESYQALGSPARWRIDGAPWQEASNTMLPHDIRLVAQYNALEDERMVFAWYHYANVSLEAGQHRLSISVVEPRPRGLNIDLANTMAYSKQLDCIVLSQSPLVFKGKVVVADPSAAGSDLPLPRANLLANPSLEEDIGCWSAAERVDGRWKAAELAVDRGWDRDFWRTYRAGGEGRIQIRGLMDMGGLRLRQSFVGVRSLRIRAGRSERRMVSRRIPLVSGDVITFGGYIRADKLAADARIEAEVVDSAGQTIATVQTDQVSGTTHWQRFSRTGYVVPPVPGGCALVISCSVGSADAGMVWFDDLFVCKTN